MIAPTTETLRPIYHRKTRDPVLRGGTHSSWWSRYSGSLAKFSRDSRTVIEIDSRLIAASAMPRSEGPQVRTGLVVGSVQSGKTASMLAVAALLLDQGLDILVILAGTRVALWTQTYERLLGQLDSSTPETAWERDAYRVLVPAPADILGDETRADPHAYLNGVRTRVRRAAAAKKPCIFVIPKEDEHLHALSLFLDSIWADDQSGHSDAVLRMVVLDDEADDASLLNASQGNRITPEYIQRLWVSRNNTNTMRTPHLVATYIAYTATPQANYLQASHNPLAPRDFHFTLRTPSNCGELQVRDITFYDREGLRSHYIGGHDFYERLRGTPGDFCSVVRYPERHAGESDEAYELRFAAAKWGLLADALRAYFVAGALRLLDSERSFGSLHGNPILPLAEMTAATPPTHTMLYHPSALRELHFLGAEDISRWSSAPPGEEASTEALRDATGAPVLDCDGLKARLSGEAPLWRDWMHRFNDTDRLLTSEAGGSAAPWPSHSWEAVRRVLESEVFANTRLRVLNSDPRADERPRFSPLPDPSHPGHFRRPPDIFTIFVAGNVLSRGLTVEGLATSLFLRSSREPAADTQMQMQRWFGYRGAFLKYCRVFMFDDQYELFRSYHVNDVALKCEVLSSSERNETPFVNGVLVLQGSDFRATHKVPTLHLPLHPGPTPSIRLVEPQDTEENRANLDLLFSWLNRPNWTNIAAPQGTLRGVILADSITLGETADLLDQLRYSRHDPAPDAESSKRWASLGALMHESVPFFRPPGQGHSKTAVDPNSCPYSIAAYLRTWDAALRYRTVPGLYPTDSPATSWGLIDIDSYRQSRPRFYVAIRYGSGGAAHDSRLSARGVTTMRRQSVNGRPWMLETLWGTRGREASYFGDQFVDYHHHGTRPVPELHRSASWRPRGHPGLVLFHVIRHEHGHDTLAVGLAIPHGGPDHIAALRVD